MSDKANAYNVFAHLRAKKRELKNHPIVQEYLDNEKAIKTFKGDLKEALLAAHGEPAVGESFEDSTTFGGLTCVLTHVPESLHKDYVRFSVK